MTNPNRQVAFINNEQIREKVKIKLGGLMSEFLGDFCLKTIERGVIRNYVLEQCVVAKLYKRYLERFTLRKAGEFTLESYEVIALKRLLMETSMADGSLADNLRNELLGLLHKEITFY